MIEARLIGPRQFEFVESPTPEPGPGEVLLQIGAVAVCGSEFAPYLGLATEFPLYRGVLKYPRRIGHEASAVVAALGPGVKGLEVGQAVMPIHSVFATHALVRADAGLVPIPAGVSLEHAALGYMGFETYFLCREMLCIEPADRVLIIGLGPFGALCLEQVREIGCHTIVGIDLDEQRLALARELGVTHTFSDSRDAMDLQPSVVIESTGQSKPIQDALRVAANGATVALAGRPYRPLNDFTIEDVFQKFLTVIGGKIPSRGYAPEYRGKALEMIRDGRIHADRLVSHVLPLRRVGEAFDIAIARGGMKVVVDCRAV